MTSEDKDLTVERSMEDFKRAYKAKRKLIERERDDFLFALGEQWSQEDVQKLQKAGIKPFTDNRIQPNIHLITGLERQNRTEFKAFPQGEEDGIKAEIASALFRDSIKKSGFSFKSSDQFKDGITCGESHLELYLEHIESIITGTPCWRKCDGNTLFPDPTCREYDLSDARFVYKLTLDIDQGDLINLYPDKKAAIEASNGGRLDTQAILNADGAHIQPKDYPKHGESDPLNPDAESESYDLIERYYKKWVEVVYIGDYDTGELKPAADEETAQGFIDKYAAGIEQDKQDYQDALNNHQSILQQHANMYAGVDPNQAPMPPQAPPPPPEKNPQRFKIIKRMVPEIWCFAHTPGVSEPLCDVKAWFYPKWKNYPFVTYFARFSTAPLTGDHRHLLIQGLVHGVKGAQEKHNKAELLMLRHLNTSTNSGWLSEEDAWVDPKKVEEFGTAAGVNLEYKQGKQMPQRIVPVPLSTAHAQISAESAEAIKAQLGINADLLATQQGGTDSGRAIALRQRQGLLMVQELFDNLSRTRQIAGRLILSQLGEIYDTETAIKILGEGFLKTNFPPPMLNNPDNPQAPPQPMPDKFGRPMMYDKEMAEVAIAEVLSGELDNYEVSVGDTVASDTQLMATSAEIKEIAQQYPGLVPPEMLIRYSQLPQAAKNEVSAIAKQAAQAAQVAPRPGGGLPSPMAGPAA